MSLCVCVLLSVLIISFQMYFMYLVWEKAVIDTALKATFRLHYFSALQHFLLLTSVFIKPAPNVFVAICMCLACCSE